MVREWRESWDARRDALRARWESCPPQLIRLGGCALRLAAGALLGAGVLLGRCSPFGLAFVGASGAGLYGACALLGVCVGSFLGLPFADALRYAAAAILIFAVAYAFGGARVCRRPWFMPATVMAMTAITGTTVLIGHRDPAAALCLITEVLLAGFCCLCYRLVFLEPEGAAGRAQQISQLTLIATLLLPLVRVAPFAGLSWGRAAAALTVLLLASRGGVGVGSAVGLVLGTTVDLADGGAAGPCYTALYGIAGLLSGLLSRRRRWVTVLACAVGGVLASLWAAPGEEGTLYEMLVACGGFLLLPEPAVRQTEELLHAAAAEGETERRLDLAREGLEERAAAFRQLYETLRLSVPPAAAEPDMAAVYDRAAARVCRTCAMWNACWQKDYDRTYRALSETAPVLLKRGRAAQEDFPSAFTARCLHLSEFLYAVNGELSILFYRRRYSARLRESRRAVCRQYEDLSGALDTAAAALRCAPRPEPGEESRLRHWLTEHRIASDGRVFRDERDRLRVEVRGPDAALLERPEQARQLAALFGTSLRSPVAEREDGAVRLVFRQEEPYGAIIGVAACRKDGEAVSGDAGTYFKTEDGTLYLILSDGMGSGAEAARESRLAIRLLERFLRAGVGAEAALRTIRGALALRWEQEGGFATLDLLRVDLFTGRTELGKYGAAASYVRRQGRVSRVSCHTLPPGLEEDLTAPEITRFRLEPEDLVVLVSDGVDGGAEDGWLRQCLAEWRGESPRELAQTLLDRARQCRESRDDRTVLVLRLTRRRKLV